MRSKHFTLTDVRALAPTTLEMRFADGEHLRVDLASIISAYPTLGRLAVPEVFAIPRLVDGGSAVAWGDDDMLELAADNLRAHAIEQAGGYSHEVIYNWMARHGLTLDGAAQALGLSRRMLAYYRGGAKPVPRTVALACLGWESEQRKAA